MKRSFIVLLVAVCTFLGLGVALAGPASATITTCDSWYTSSWGRFRQCHTTDTNNWVMEFSDYGSPDGLCVYLKGLSDNTGSWYSLDSSCDTTVRTASVDSFFADWKWVLFRGTSPTAWMTGCNADDGNPAPVAGRPYCFSE